LISNTASSCLNSANDRNAGPHRFISQKHSKTVFVALRLASHLSLLFSELQFPLDIKIKVQAMPVTGREGPQGVRRRGSHIFSRKSAHRWR
jgi:hypothetical protein